MDPMLEWLLMLEGPKSSGVDATTDLPVEDCQVEPEPREEPREPEPREEPVPVADQKDSTVISEDAYASRKESH